MIARDRARRRNNSRRNLGDWRKPTARGDDADGGDRGSVGGEDGRSDGRDPGLRFIVGNGKPDPCDLGESGEERRIDLVEVEMDVGEHGQAMGSDDEGVPGPRGIVDVREVRSGDDLIDGDRIIAIADGKDRGLAELVHERAKCRRRRAPDSGIERVSEAKQSVAELERRLVPPDESMGLQRGQEAARCRSADPDSTTQLGGRTRPVHTKRIEQAQCVVDSLRGFHHSQSLPRAVR